MPVSEQVGRPFVELQIVDFLFYMYGEQKTADMLEAAAKAGEASASRSKRKASQAGMIDYGADAGPTSWPGGREPCASATRRCRTGSSTCMVEKRGGPAAAAPAAAVGP